MKLSTLKKVLNKVDNVIEYICMVTLVILVCIVFFQVFTRYILGFTPRWSEETAVILMIWLGFITTAIGVKRGTHLSISAVVDLFPKSVQNIISYIDELAVMFFGIILLIYGRDLTIHTMTSTLPATQLPAGVLYAALPVAGFMIIIYTIARILEKLTQKQK